MLSKKIFSMCITSRLWHNKLSFQYERSQKILLFVQWCHSPYPSIGGGGGPVSVTFGKFLTLRQTCVGINIRGGSSLYNSPFFKAFLFILNAQSLSKNLQWQSNQEDFPSFANKKTFCVFHAIQTCQSTMCPPTRQHAISRKIINSLHQSCPHHEILLSLDHQLKGCK